MPPANIIPIAVRARSLRNVLADLREARRDYDQALEDVKHATLGMHQRHYGDLDDRATEAETRLGDLREEFERRLTDATGLTFEQLLKCREECLV
jgi:hypothetical protein